MPLQVNEVAIAEFSKLTGIDAAVLKSELVVEAEKPPTETKINDLLKDVVIMKKTDHATLLDNTGKNKFDEGKYRSMNDIVKLALGDKAFEVTKDMKREDVFEKIITHHKQAWEAESKLTPDVKVKELKEEKEKLQEVLSLKDQEIEKLKGENESTKTLAHKEKRIISAVASIPFSATGDILSRQKDTIVKNILSSYKHKIEDGIDVWYDSSGKKLVDSLQNPKTIEDIAKEEAVIFPTDRASGGRGDESSKQKLTGELDAELAKLTTNEQFSKFLSGRGLSPISEEGKALMSKWVEMRNKK